MVPVAPSTVILVFSIHLATSNSKHSLLFPPILLCDYAIVTIQKLKLINFFLIVWKPQYPPTPFLIEIGFGISLQPEVPE